MSTETAVRIAAKLYEIRDIRKKLMGDKWPADFAEFSGYVRSGMQKFACDELDAAKRIVEELQVRFLDSGGDQMGILAAAVEMMEPSVEGKP